ncbi:MAG: hypothetical protein V8Q32_00205, partial [Anaerotignum faecicola]
MEGLFPHRVTRVYREIDSEFLSVNVFVMKAPTKKDFHVLYTTGMSAMPMKLPQGFCRNIRIWSARSCCCFCRGMEYSDRI